MLCQYSLTEKPKNKDDIGNVFTQGTKHMVIDLEGKTKVKLEAFAATLRLK